MGRGFFDQAELTTDEMDVGRAICAMPGALCYLAASPAGEPAGAAAAAVYTGLATLFADSTIARFRRAGLHAELIAARLNEALAQGCDLATASTLPGSSSQRNYERLGFEVAYPVSHSSPPRAPPIDSRRLLIRAVQTIVQSACHVVPGSLRA